MKYVLALDVGTTTMKALIFDEKMNLVAKASRDLFKDFPRDGWVEQDPLELVSRSKEVIKEVFVNSGINPVLCVMGITNQRETTIIWNKKTGKPVYPAIVWEDNRTEEFCSGQKQGTADRVLEKTGLPLIPYFSVSKICWILNSINFPRLWRDKGGQVDLLFGTVDTWLMWNLCTDNPHVTDKTNASRTLLYNIYDQKWDNDLLAEFDIPKSIIPEVLDSISDFGSLDKSVVGYEIPVVAVCGDQQASMTSALSICHEKDACTKITFGTGTFIMQIANAKTEATYPFFKTITPSLRHEVLYALETKINRGAKQVDQILDKPEELDSFLKELASDVIVLLNQFPQIPTEIVIDGGVSRDGIIAKHIEDISGVKTKSLPIFDGTALGIAILAGSRLE
ncbi:hypothetical protein CO057_01470 [Candidatus Uhrbacteria bacterium CG_4_9_14_0_2_um_filter_41_50]|uniref:Carbohydrate kinase FGGY N-terminal domain-containing protein n=1 Tax=Candidatus Uhrbacteria bacterium CG_4_9_14_0_2_um_filter_41_50 TaxID=1975031 RepID=A0A2M8EPR6_9BACT|nr:MAG: hypothetical protein COZ45_03850 [Candidatus Uhrbacteria bacterium CG_4_10_14_3_um_filter_41_21]PIZ54733.1 MAG: hypothetical protein COY24_02775 [Candidatus Uhrbacteria bacterium CG_4_10_14_0_2_um_filter_41_21]PJB85106.1 MAG: hypothetical protein CO086_00120 [Candidatus Uhrbacteria bacterium CG_4_9_14_0_8_um_filter_41_16]PJC24714.1 MAG: hypothetical protein CO057_01470 [Candidatus Uhrbacteria bacterium CG_4_9_14_0_2_um_filter_41_50]PJE75456.1 MAG: hypothetical protein COV03_00120 [Candi